MLIAEVEEYIKDIVVKVYAVVAEVVAVRAVEIVIVFCSN